MGRTSKKPKSIFVQNLIARRKAMGLSAERFAEKAGLAYPTLRDIEAGINAGREETKAQIAAALGCSLADLYFSGHETPISIPPLKQSLTELIDRPDTVPYAAASVVFRDLLNVEPQIRATILAILYDDQSIAEPYLSKSGIRAKHPKAR